MSENTQKTLNLVKTRIQKHKECPFLNEEKCFLTEIVTMPRVNNYEKNAELLNNVKLKHDLN